MVNNVIASLASAPPVCPACVPQDCKSKLEKLKRDQAALRNHSYNPTSCPVCLEDFEDANGSGSGAGGAGGSGADGKAGRVRGAGPGAHRYGWLWRPWARCWAVKCGTIPPAARISSVRRVA